MKAILGLWTCRRDLSNRQLSANKHEQTRHTTLKLLNASFIGQFRIIFFWNELSLTGRLFKGVRRVGSVSPFGLAVDRTWRRERNCPKNIFRQWKELSVSWGHVKYLSAFCCCCLLLFLLFFVVRVLPFALFSSYFPKSQWNNRGWIKAFPDSLKGKQ